MEATHTVLFVDDEENILKALSRVFRREGYRLLTATSGREGLELLQANPVALIVSDQRMPEMLGAEFLRRSREVSPHTIRIMLTGHSDMEAATQAINEGEIYRYLTKPWDDGQLKRTVRDGLERFDLEAHNRDLTVQLAEKNSELEKLNEGLEQAVEARTTELRTAYDENLTLTEQLQFKVRELEGRDRVAQHLLMIHTLEETLEVLLETINGVLKLERSIIYLREDGGYRPAAAIGLRAAGAVADSDDLAELAIEPALQTLIDQVEQRPAPINETRPREAAQLPFAVVPILSGTKLLGLIEVSTNDRDRPVNDQELGTVSSFALQAAVAINDAQIHSSFSDWQGGLDQMVGEIGDLEILVPPDLDLAEEA